MVRVVNYESKTTEEGKQFFLLNLEGEVEFIKSENTGKFYATVRKCNIPSTFSEETCKGLVGKEMNGNIKKVECPPYEYANPETGEVIVLNHRYEYFPNDEIERTSPQPKKEEKELLSNFSMNGQVAHQ